MYIVILDTMHIAVYDALTIFKSTRINILGKKPYTVMSKNSFASENLSNIYPSRVFSAATGKLDI